MLGGLEHLVNREKQVISVHLAHLENREQLVNLVKRACLVNLAPGDFKVTQAKMECEVQQALRVNQVEMVVMETLVLLARRVMLVREEEKVKLAGQA